MKKFITFLSLIALIFVFNGSVFAQGADTPPVLVATITSAAAKDCAKVTNRADIKAAKDIRDTAIGSAKSIRDTALRSAQEIRDTALNAAKTLAKDAAKIAVRAAKDAYATSIRAAKDAYATSIRAAKDAYTIAVNQSARYPRDAALESASLIRNAALESARYIRNAALELAGVGGWKKNADQTAINAAKDAYTTAANAANDAYVISVRAAKDAYAVAMQVCGFVMVPETTPEPTTPTNVIVNWKTYTNSEHDYSFKYPSEWSLGDSPTSITPSPTADDIAFDSPHYTAARFAVRVTIPFSCSNLKNCVAKNRKSFSSDQQSTGTTSTVVGGKSALTETITRPTSGNWKYYVWYVLEGKKLYILHTISLAADDNVIKPTFNQILSTFKFADLQTYQSEELGISFQYPTALGKVREYKYKKTELVALKFLDDKGHSVGLELFGEAGLDGSADETLRTCDDILLNGFLDGDLIPSNCETLTVDNHSVNILTYVQGGRSNSATNAQKVVQFQTKKGIWDFKATDKNLYDDLMSIVKSLRYLQ